VSVCLCLSRLPLDTFPWNLILGTFLIFFWKNENLVPVRQKYRARNWRRMLYCCWRQGLSSSEMVSGWWDSRGVNKIAWMRRSVTLCVHCVYIVLNVHNRKSLPRESDIQCAQHIIRGPSRFNILINDTVYVLYRKNSFPIDEWIRNPGTVLCRQFGPTSFSSNGLQKKIQLRDAYCKNWNLICNWCKYECMICRTKEK
jgi:hypothetical protein